MLSHAEAAKRLESHLRAVHEWTIAECLSHDEVEAATEDMLLDDSLYQITESGVESVESVTRSDARYLRPSVAMRRRIVGGQ